MAPSHMDQGYTHKKFNYGYSHKKLGLRVRQREQENNENINQTPLEQVKSDKGSKNLFRPYALDENNTPRKRKISSSSVKSLEENNSLAVSKIETSTAIDNPQDQQQHQQQQQTALDGNNTPRKRKISSSSDKSLEENYNLDVRTTQTSPAIQNLQDQQQQQQPTALHITTNISCPTEIIYSSDYPALSPNSYNIRLQRQRAALYMRYMAQIQQQYAAATLQTTTSYPMGYPNVTAPIFNGC